MKRLILALLAASLLLFSKSSPALAVKNGVIIGLNQYTPYFAPPHYGHENRIEAKQWHYRLPFYAKILGANSVEIRDDNQAAVDKEIQFSAATGIDFWSFDYWDFMGLDPRATNPDSKDMNHVLRFYLSSQYKNSLKFVLNVPLVHIVNYNPQHAQAWDSSFIPHMRTLMKDPQYQKVLIGTESRPLVFFSVVKEALPYFGDTGSSQTQQEQNLKAAIIRFRTAMQAEGLKNPYIVSFEGDNPIALRLGLDAVGEYTMQYGNGIDTGQLRPYADLARSNINIWNSAHILPFIPTLNTGWDYRPNCPDPTNCNYGNSPKFQQPTPQELSSHLSNAVNWINANPGKSPVKVLYIYSGQEYPEGGWFTPTIYEGDARQEAVAQYLKGTYFNNIRFKGRDINGDQKIDMADVNKLASDYGKSLDPIPLNSDITADGKVNIFDYNALLEYYGK